MTTNKHISQERINNSFGEIIDGSDTDRISSHRDQINEFLSGNSTKTGKDTIILSKIIKDGKIIIVELQLDYDNKIWQKVKTVRTRISQNDTINPFIEKVNKHSTHLHAHDLFLNNINTFLNSVNRRLIALESATSTSSSVSQTPKRSRNDDPDHPIKKPRTSQPTTIAIDTSISSATTSETDDLDALANVASNKTVQ